MDFLFPDIQDNPKPKTPFERSLSTLQKKCRLLTLTNPKLAKGLKKNYLSAVLMLAPGDLSGHEVCKFRSPGCTRACLNTAGRGGMVKGGALQPEDVIQISNAVQRARLNRTLFLYQKTPAYAGVRDTPVVHEAFASMLVNEINMLIAFCKEHKLHPAVRLNGTSDLRWEAMPVHARRSIFALYPRLQFYDYTKYPIGARPGIPSNYYLIYSWNEQPIAEMRSAEWLSNGFNVAAVFSTAKNKPLPRAWTIAGTQFRVIDGDASDLRFKDPRGVIVGLRAKGFAKKDESGFVIQVDQDNPRQEQFDFDGGDLFPDMVSL